MSRFDLETDEFLPSHQCLVRIPAKYLLEKKYAFTPSRPVSLELRRKGIGEKLDFFLLCPYHLKRTTQMQAWTHPRHLCHRKLVALPACPTRVSGGPETPVPNGCVDKSKSPLVRVCAGSSTLNCSRNDNCDERILLYTRTTFESTRTRCIYFNPGISQNLLHALCLTLCHRFEHQEKTILCSQSKWKRWQTAFFKQHLNENKGKCIS